MTWREYHELTKHSPESLRRAAGGLDWRNMPDPFRHYEGVPVLDLPADPLLPQVPALDILRGAPAAAPVTDGAALLSSLLFYSAAISASKRVPSTGYKYALRVNPSSGNLHPTEFHFITSGLNEWPDGLYHYRPSSHMVEQRALGLTSLIPEVTSAPVMFVLTSIAWREAWKYRERAYRYCLLDIGHAWQALALAATALGCISLAFGDFPDDALRRGCRLNGDEWPMLLVRLQGLPITVREPEPAAATWFEGQANRLSSETIVYPAIDAIHDATKRRRAGLATVPDNTARSVPPLGASTRSFGEVVRSRRSALDFLGGAQTMSLAELSAILTAATSPLSADFAPTRSIRLYLYVHRVTGLEPGVYRHTLDGSSELELLKRGDQRVIAAGLSLAQDLAGNACVAFSMIADLERAAAMYGDRGYRYVHFEAGAIGQRLYLAAEALGLQATGIGAFFDDQVNAYLELNPAEGQVIYHFAIGHAVADPRLGA
jgi:SagB-type dehydrogenase family enzyme